MKGKKFLLLLALGAVLFPAVRNRKPFRRTAWQSGNLIRRMKFWKEIRSRKSRRQKRKNP